MADITWTDVTNHYASLASPAVSSAAQTDILAYVNDEALEASVFGGDDASTYKLARIHLAAHYGEIEARNARAAGAVGPASSKSINATGMSVTYSGSGAVSVNDNAFLTTPGGTAFRSLVRSNPRARLFARSC